MASAGSSRTPLADVEPAHFKGLCGISGEGRSRQKEAPAIAKVGGHRDTREWPRNPRNTRNPPLPPRDYSSFSFDLFHLCTAQRRATPLGVEGGKTGDGWGRGPWIPWLIRGGMEGSRIVPSITCPEIPGRTPQNTPNPPNRIAATAIGMMYLMNGFHQGNTFRRPAPTFVSSRNRSQPHAKAV